MDNASLHREICGAIAAARMASDPEQGALMDRIDLQRTIAQLLATLQKIENAYDQSQTGGDRITDSRPN